jgi:hypothetical protein
MFNKAVKVTGPNGEEGEVRESSVAVWEAHGWTVAPEEEAPAGAAAPASSGKKGKAPRDDSTETLGADGPAA